ncbi:MAG: hypothetical protein ABSE98_12185 [Acidimicrobiales bacterium]
MDSARRLPPHLTEGGEGHVAVPHLTLTLVPTGMELDKSDESVWGSV